MIEAMSWGPTGRSGGCSLEPRMSVNASVRVPGTAVGEGTRHGLVAVAPSLLVLVPAFGLAGAAASLVLAQSVTAVLLARRLGRELDIHPLRMMIPDAEDARLLREAIARGLRRG